METNKSFFGQFADRYAIPVAIVIAGLAIAFALYRPAISTGEAAAKSDFVRTVTPSEGVTIPVVWGDLGKRLVSAGVIDREKLTNIYGGITKEQAALLDGSSAGELKINSGNARYLLNLFWALGLGNKNPILRAEMADPAYAGVQNFASTGGWTVSTGNPMDHYDKYELLNITPEQQRLVDSISQNIYRPCCDNSTHFPDCNHGMAMLALLELMASQGRSEAEMYRAALTVNSYWFPDEYRTLAAYFASKGTDWKDVSPKEVLGREYSSASGYARVAAIMQPEQSQGGSCGV